MKEETGFIKIEFFLERLYISNEISVQVYNSDTEIILQIGVKQQDNNPFYTDEELIKKLAKESKKVFYPVLEIEDDIFIYGLFNDKDGRCYVFGPIALEIAPISKLYEYRKRHGIVSKEYNILHKPLISLTNALSSAFLMCTGEMIEEKKILLRNEDGLKEIMVGEREVNQYQFEKAEYNTEHLSYQYEQGYLAAIENGDADFFKGTLLEEPKALEKIGILAKDSIKHMEYMCVSSTVLVSRAAMRGGMNPSAAYVLSELYLQKLEKCKNTQEILNLHQTMHLDFVTKVREQIEKRRSEDYIEKCKDYISERVHYPLRIKEIADMIGMNHSYLSKKFKEREGMTLVQYSIDAKLHTAANMLKYSEASIAEIADYFCFASQSRFGDQFKKKYGVTPKVYRKENKVIEFTTSNKNVYKNKK